MMHSYEAEIDIHGRIRLLEPTRLHGPCRAVVTVLESVSDEGMDRAMSQVAKRALSQDRERSGEDDAWVQMQSANQWVTENQHKSASEKTIQGNSVALLRLLRENRLPRKECMTGEEIDAQIAAEREAWD
ncbi:MAG: hypothetical protein HQL76_10520 [Magnetococcales bacterium]|nr:hypothetical protein [Magnetococcales bacterium]